MSGRMKSNEKKKCSVIEATAKNDEKKLEENEKIERATKEKEGKE